MCQDTKEENNEEARQAVRVTNLRVALYLEPKDKVERLRLDLDRTDLVALKESLAVKGMSDAGLPPQTISLLCDKQELLELARQILRDHNPTTEDLILATLRRIECRLPEKLSSD